MSKQKYSAAEKHFHEKELGLNKKIQFLEHRLAAKEKENVALKNQFAEESANKDYKIAQLEDHVERLCKYMDLPKSYVQQAFQDDVQRKKTNPETLNLLGSLVSMFSQLYR